MSTAIIITLCILLLLAYVFDITSPHTKVPSVVLLLLLGWLVKQFSVMAKIEIPDLGPLLPILGSVGLILIVLEGALELELRAEKKKLILRSVLSALFPIGIISITLALLLRYYTGHSLRLCLINIIPLAVISSSIAISTGRNLNKENREFVVYESSLSDIFGVLFFNFMVINESLNVGAVSEFSIQLALVLAVSFIATVGLSFLLSRINHHIKFAPIILLVILIYEVSKVYHLPALIFILIFGLFLGNLEEIKNVRWIEKLKPQLLATEVNKFKEITAEATFLIRALFFLLFGFLIQNEEILDTGAMLWAGIIVATIFVVRLIVLKLLGSRLNPLVFIAPRGLITILLYFAVESAYRVDLISRSVVLQVILFTALIMMFGMMLSKKEKAILSERHEVS